MGHVSNVDPGGQVGQGGPDSHPYVLTAFEQ
jgi:hypothetical protein